MASQFEGIAVKLSSGAIVRIEASSPVVQDSATNVGEKTDGFDTEEFEDEDVSFGLPSFASVKETIIGFSNEIVDTFQQVSPSKASVEFALKLTSDKQTVWASIVPIAGEIHLKVTLEWSEQE